MLHLIAKAAEHLLPAPLHRVALRIASRIRHRWRMWRKVSLRACCVIISNSAGEVLMIRHTYGPRVWGFPGGGIERGEEPRDAAIREVREELGIVLDTVEPLGAHEEVVSDSPQTAFIYTAITDAAPKPDGREIDEARYFALDDLPDSIGRITRARLEAWREQMRGDHSSDS